MKVDSLKRSPLWIDFNPGQNKTNNASPWLLLLCYRLHPWTKASSTNYYTEHKFYLMFSELSSAWQINFIVFFQTFFCGFLNSLRIQPTFGDSSTGFPAKWRLRNERKNSILMTRHYSDLGSASDWLKICFLKIMHLKHRFSKEFVFEWTEEKGFRVQYTAHKRRLNLLLFWRSPCCSLRASGSRVTSRDSPKWRAVLAGYHCCRRSRC